ncbi:hypothetical protein TNCV_4770821 [Trichonephila clavipes]|nr:hypothetical protein TNCV_4770821 [Trichonephila clavipes]
MFCTRPCRNNGGNAHGRARVPLGHVPLFCKRDGQMRTAHRPLHTKQEKSFRIWNSSRNFAAFLYLKRIPHPWDVTESSRGSIIPFGLRRNDLD